MLSTFASCSSKEPEELEPLSEELKAEIIAAAEEEWGEDIIWIWAPLGIFEDGKVAVMCQISPHGYIYSIEKQLKVASKEISLPDSTFSLYIYHDSEFTDIKTAYSKRVISRKDISDIHYHYYDKYYVEHSEREKMKSIM